MEFTEAIARLRGMSSTQLRGTLMDPAADTLLRGVAAGRLTARNDVSLAQKLAWLSEAWDSAPRPVKEGILWALASCRSPEAIELVKTKLSGEEFQWARILLLTELGDPDILGTCEHILRYGTEVECSQMMGALRRRGTPEAVALLEIAMQSGPTPRVRRSAAEKLASLGISTGEHLLESELIQLQGLRAQSTADDGLNMQFVAVARSLTDINNKNGFVALKELINTAKSDDSAIKILKSLTFGMLNLTHTTTLDDWKQAMERWLDEKHASAAK